MKPRIKIFHWLALTVLIVSACTVTFITGYDEVIDTMTTRMKGDFNLHFIKLARTIQDTNPSNQAIENFQDYYDHMNADLITLTGRASNLGEKSRLVKEQVQNLDSILHNFERMHVKGLPDRPGDDRRDIRNAVNSSFDAVIKLQEQLKSTGKNNSAK